MTTEREVLFASGSLHMAGTLRLPDSGGPCPAVLLIPGSGQVDRNENAARLPINAFSDIAVHLSGQGVATLRYDKRGVGASEGDFWESGFFDNAADAAAALICLESQEEIQPAQVFLLGHSEGALIATRLAAILGDEVAGVILLAGPAQRGEEVLLWQAVQVMKGMHGFNKWLIDLLHVDVRKAQQKQLDKIKRSKKNWYRVQLVTKVNAKWLREFIAYNPADDLLKIQVPVLAIVGTKDIQVDPADLDRMAALIRTELEAHAVPNLTHILRVEPGEPTLSTYQQQVAQPVDPQVLQIVSEWLRKKTAA